MNIAWFSKKISEIYQDLSSGENGLTKNEAQRRLQEYGANKLPEGGGSSGVVIFLSQFKSPLIYILFIACIIVFAMGEVVDGTVILAVLLLNAVVGAIQEGKAQNTLLALKKFVETKATVLREGKEIIMPDSEVVPGDIIILQEGEKIPVDARVISSANLRVDESALTGESEPKHKLPDVLKGGDLPTSDQTNMVFKGTHVVAGSGKAIVVATGIETVIGKISKEISAIDTEVPLKANVRYLSRLIIIVAASVCAFLFALGMFSGKTITEMFTTVVSLSVSIIPEGLPIVMTLVLVTGVWRMSKRNALVKKLQAVEALGQARVIAVDKTGTITKNELIVKKLYVGEEVFDITGEGYEPSGDAKLKGSVVGAVDHPGLALSGKISAFCANARVMFSEEDKSWHVTGDPTEAAMVVFASKLGIRKSNLEEKAKLIGELPFDYKLKYHAKAHQCNGKKTLSVVGAPETILKMSQKVWRAGKSHVLKDDEFKRLEEQFIAMSQEGLRVIALAQSHDVPNSLEANKIENLTFVGFLGMKDTLRPEAIEAVQKTASAGIRVVMITGDHKITAQAIAKEAGIYKDGDNILTGGEIDNYSKDELASKLNNTSVFARVTPEHKLRIVNAYKSNGEIVAMTGDGVNDAPSLVAADLGVAMGKIGTEVAKEASDIILLDDNFVSIVAAVEEGRSIYKTIKKVILYLFSTSWGEVLTIGTALFLGFPLPILPAQIIWLNFVTDGFLDVALAMENKEEGLLRGDFSRPKKYLVDKIMVKRLLLMGIPMMLGTIFLFSRYYQQDMTKAVTVSLTVLAVFQWFNAWNCRHESKSVFQMKFFANKFLVGATIAVIFLQFLVVYNPFMQKFLRTTSLGLIDWLMIIPVGASILFVEEIRKYFYRKRQV